MAWWIVRQPNGRFARYSGVINKFMVMNLTREQMINGLVSGELLLTGGVPESQVELLVTSAEASYPEGWISALEGVEIIHEQPARVEAERLGELTDAAIEALRNA